MDFNVINFQYSLLKNKPDVTMKEIEDSFGGSLCRCTGYRPILHSFKSFGSDAPKSVVNEFTDIEVSYCCFSTEWD